MASFTHTLAYDCNICKGKWAGLWPVDIAIAEVVHSVPPLSLSTHTPVNKQTSCRLET